MAESTTGQQPADGKKPQIDLTGAEWHSSGEGSADVQIAFAEGCTVMRGGRDPDGPVLVFTPAEWKAFVLGARDGDFT